MPTATSAPDESGFFLKILETMPGFVYGLIVGFISGLGANWVWDKIKKGKKSTHLSVEVDESGTFFSGHASKTQAKSILRTLDAAFSMSATKKKKGSKYSPDKDSSKS